MNEKAQRSVRKKPWWKIWTNYHKDVRYLEIDYSVQEREKQIRKIVDDNGFKFIIFFVAASGFLATSYSLFATNVVMPSLYYIYPVCGRSSNAAEVIDLVTLVGTVMGMLCIGHLADRAGRKRLYGGELAILIFATMGVVQASDGFMIQVPGKQNGNYNAAMDIYDWISWWRFMLGFGIGAEYPLSSIIAAEWSSTESRGTMLAAVFSMQSVSRLLAFAVNLGAIRDFNLANSIESQLAADRAWRLTIGVGAIPAIIAVVFRLTIPETPRYYADIMKDLRKAVKNALKVYGRNKKVNSVNTDSSPQNGDEENDHWFQGAWNFLTGPKKAWKNLTSISVLWAILDVAWYGLSFDSPSALSTLTHVPSSSSPWNPTNCTSQWDTDSWKSSITIHDMLQEDSIRSILIVSIASLVGSLTAIVIINRFRRKLILVTTFLFLSLLFAISGGTLIGTYRANENHTVTTAFYAILQFVFNMGPNTLIFVLAAEMFPTVYRGTFYGIAAASGKIGAICIRAIAARTGDKEMSLGIRLLAFIPFMLLAALISTTLPDVQYLPQKIDIEASVEQQAGPPESDNRSPEEENAMPRPDQPQVPDGEDAIQRASTSSDGTSLHALEPNQPEHEAQKAWFLGRLKNKALEEIAPNPAWDRTERNGVKKKAKESASGAT